MTDQQIAKWIDQLQGELDTLKRTAGSGGSAVTITPTLQSGEKLADYSIDGTPGAIYAPPVLDYYSTTERVVGEWIDGRNIYQKTIFSETQVELTNSAWTVIPWENAPESIDMLIDAELAGNVPNGSYNYRFTVDNGAIKGAASTTGNFPPSSAPVYVTIRYSKPKAEPKEKIRRTK